MTASKSHSLAIHTASWPVAWTSTANPSSRNARCSSAAIFGASSTTSSRMCRTYPESALRARLPPPGLGPDAVTIPRKDEATMKAAGL